jgi:hypothetical protein
MNGEPFVGLGVADMLNSLAPVYAWGAIPAGLTGLSYGGIASRLPRPIKYLTLRCGLLAAFLGFVITSIEFPIRLAFVAGLPAGFVCGLLVRVSPRADASAIQGTPNHLYGVPRQ